MGTKKYLELIKRPTEPAERPLINKCLVGNVGKKVLVSILGSTTEQRLNAWTGLRMD